MKKDNKYELAVFEDNDKADLVEYSKQMQESIEKALDNNKGEKGEKGDKGDSGNSLPIGGTTGQVLTKNSETDGDASWKDSAGGDNLPVGTIVDYDGDTVPDGYEEVDSMDINNGVVLWENPDTTVEFIAQTINLSSSNYDYVEISFARRIIDDVGNKIRIEKAEKNTSGHTESEYLTTGSSVNIASRLFSISDNTISFENNLLQQTGSSRAINNNYNVPIKVIGYKNKISIALEQESVYSTEEVIVGKWFGKPLYRKVLNITLPEEALNSDYECADLSSVNIDKLVKLEGLIDATSTQVILNLAYKGNIQYCSCYYAKETKKLRYATNNEQYVNVTAYIILEYTKTTDTEGV